MHKPVHCNKCLHDIEAHTLYGDSSTCWECASTLPSQERCTLTVTDIAHVHAQRTANRAFKRAKSAERELAKLERLLGRHDRVSGSPNFDRRQNDNPNHY